MLEAVSMMGEAGSCYGPRNITRGESVKTDLSEGEISLILTLLSGMAHKYAATLDRSIMTGLKEPQQLIATSGNSDAAYKRYFDGKRTFNRPSEIIGILAL
jgi:hypothetical protein